MAFIKCSGGGKMRETILWENPNSTASFASQQLALNYGGVTHTIADYDYIGIRYIYLTTNSAYLNFISDLYSVRNFGNFLSFLGVCIPRVGFVEIIFSLCKYL